MKDWRKLSRDDASNLSKEWNSMESEKFMELYGEWDSELPSSLSADYRELRRFVLNLYDHSLNIQDGGNGKYRSDLDFAIGLYVHLNDIGMNPGIASDDDVWRYIQMKVVPDVVYDRWSGNEDVRINNERFWKNTRRIWFKVLWWYVHLSLQDGPIENTWIILQRNTADDISQLVERSGSGYRVDLYRAIMKRYSRYQGNDKYILRKVLKLNVVNCATIEPLFISSGIDEYVNSLFLYFE